MALICIDCRYVNGRPSGIGELVGSMMARLPGLAPDLDFLALTSPAAPAPLSGYSNYSEYRLPAAANGPATMWWLSKCVDLDKVDLFHATFNIMPAGLRMPCVTTIHDLMWLTNPALCEAGAMRLPRQAFFRHGIARALKRSAALATVSEATKTEILRLKPALGERTHVTLSGVDAEFRPVDVEASDLAALGLDPARRRVLTVGQFAPYKNHRGAVTAFALAAAEREDVDLVLVQRQGRQSEELLKLAKKLGVAGRVKLLKSISRRQLIRLYSAASLLLHPSYCEGFGNPLAEAMACGCPVVTSDRSAMPEVTDGAAVTAAPDNHAEIAAGIGAILDDPKLSSDMRRRGLERAADLTWDRFARANLAIYRQLLSGG